MTEVGTGKRVHLVAIGGTGMGSLAVLLAEAGHRITGSDHALYPPMSDILAEAGIDVREGFDPSHIPDGVDLVVIGNAVSRENVEAVAATERGHSLASFPSALADLFLATRHSIVIAGTHGKTTTTSMAAWLLESAGFAPGFLIGGRPANFGVGARLGSGDAFVVEGDEYDTAYFDKGPKFLHYRPRTAVIGNVEFDHADIYRDLEHVIESFEKLARLVPSDGRLLLASGDPHTPRLRAAAAATVETVGRVEASDWRIFDEQVSEGGTRFRVRRRFPDGAVADLGPFELSMAGDYNVLNATFAMAAASSFPISGEALAEGLASFRGVGRRLQVVGTERGITVVDDFAHHPTAVAATVGALRASYPGRRLWVLFEPRSATSRRSVFQERYVEALSGADRVLVAPLFAPEKIAEEQRLDLPRLLADLTARGTPATCPGEADAMVETVVAEGREGDVVAALSSGAFGGIHRKLLAALSS